MATDPRRFDDLIQTVKALQAQLATLQSTVLNRTATHKHPYDAPATAITAGSSDVSFANAAWGSVPVVVSVDTAGWVLSGTKIYPPSTGYYLLNGSIYFQGSGGTIMAARFQVNGTPVPYSQANSAATSAAGNVMPNPVVVHLTSSDYVELQGYQNSGAARTTLGAQTAFTVTLLGT